MKQLTLPVVRAKRVFHIGSMDVSQKGSHFSDSFEGHCLSVSHCPKAWRSIAKLGGFPLWALSKTGATFLDVHKIAKSKKLRKVIEVWGADKGCVKFETLWRAWQSDENGEWGYMLFATEQEALDQVEGEEEGPDGGLAVQSAKILVGTATLCERVRLGNLSDRDSFDFLAMVWAIDTQPAIDGIWWRDDFDPFSLSAPRGGIFPHKLDQWLVAASDFGAVSDDESGKSLRCGFMPISAM